MNVLAAVPVKRFFVAKRRLSPILDCLARVRLATAAHTISTVEKSGIDAVPLASDDDVACMADGAGMDPMVDRRGLAYAAHDATVRAAASAMADVHADLPLVTPETSGRPPPSRSRQLPSLSDDGRTSLIGGHRPFRFAYGPGASTAISPEPTTRP